MIFKKIADTFVTVAPAAHLALGGYMGFSGVRDTTKMFKMAMKANDRMLELTQKKDLTDEEKEEFESLKYVFLSSVGMAAFGGIKTLFGLGCIHAALTELDINLNELNREEINNKLDTIMQVQGIEFHNNLRTASDVIALCKNHGITEEELRSCFETWKNEDPEAKEGENE